MIWQCYLQRLVMEIGFWNSYYIGCPKLNTLDEIK